ncbi:reverse transcriptase domain-containing protein [Tanacetum coccineum]
MRFYFSLEGSARIWLEKEPPRSILTWDDLVSKFINQFFPPSKTINLRNEIMRFQQRFDESFYEAWDRFNDLLRACPHHGFSELHQLDTFYNALNANDQDSLNSAASGNFLDKMPHECLKIIESKSKVQYDEDYAYRQAKSPSSRAHKSGRATCGGAHSYRNCPAVDGNVYRDNIQEYVSQATAANFNQGNTNSRPLMNTYTNAQEDLKGINYPNLVAYQGPTIPTSSSPKVVERGTEVTKDTVFPTNNENTEDVHPPVVPVKNQILVSEPVVAPVSAPMPNPKPSIPYPSRRNDEKRRENANEQIEKFYEIFKDMSFEISFMDALTLMPKFASTLKALIGNKEKLSEMARTPLNEHCSAVILNKLPKKLGDPGRFLIPCKFPGMEMSVKPWLIFGVRIKLHAFSCGNSLTSKHDTDIPADFVVVDFEPDPRVPLILGRCFLKTGRALIDVYEGELTLRVGNEAITYNLDQTSRYSANYNDMTANRIDVVELACEEYSQEILGFSNVIASGNPTPEADAFLALADDPTSSKVDESYYDPEGDILILEALLNSDPSPTLNQGNYFLENRRNLKFCELKTAKSSIINSPMSKHKDLPPSSNISIF